MATEAGTLPARPGTSPSTAGAIDVDIHPAVPGMAALLPYLDAHWREQVTVRGIDGLDSVMWKPWLPISCRPDWRPATGKPGESLALLRAQALDAFGTERRGLQPALGRPGAALARTWRSPSAAR